MRVGILETGAPPAGLAERFGRYDAMMARLLGPGFETTAFRVELGELPDRPEAFGGLLVTGSAAGVYDPLPWIAPLTEFLRRAKGRTKLVGICFGHQIMAEAFGGRAAKSAKGWGLGLQRYAVRERAPWMDGDAGSIAIPASHQDQVVALPPGARVLAGSDFTPYGALAYADQPAVSIQLHPEYEPDFAKALLASSHAGRLDPAEFARLSASLDEPNDCVRVRGWIGRFLRGPP